jgi:hypothetical protein
MADTASTPAPGIERHDEFTALRPRPQGRRVGLWGN